jgi:hypothetical protein
MGGSGRGWRPDFFRRGDFYPGAGSFLEDAKKGVCTFRSPDEFNIFDVLKFTIPREERDLLPAGNGVADAIDRGELFACTRCFSSHGRTLAIIFIRGWHKGDHLSDTGHHLPGFFRVVPAHGKRNFADVELGCYQVPGRVVPVIFISFKDFNDGVRVCKKEAIVNRAFRPGIPGYRSSSQGAARRSLLRRPCFWPGFSLLIPQKPARQRGYG